MMTQASFPRSCFPIRSHVIPVFQFTGMTIKNTPIPVVYLHRKPPAAANRLKFPLNPAKNGKTT
jgi:hypothetical protein